MDAVLTQLLERQILKPAAGLLDSAPSLAWKRKAFACEANSAAAQQEDAPSKISPLENVAAWLSPGRVHEFSLGNFFEMKRAWDAPLTLLAALAMEKADSFITNIHPPTYSNPASPPAPIPPGCIAWIGRACWPMHQLLAAGSGRRHLFLDPGAPAEMVWGISEAARCPSVKAIVADAIGLDAVASRRIQLAAERGGGVVLLARPPWENDQASWAATRWRVSPEPSAAAHPRWKMELRYAKGTRPGVSSVAAAAAASPIAARAPTSWIVEWNYEVFSGKGALDISAAVGSGSDTPAVRAAHA